MPSTGDFDHLWMPFTFHGDMRDYPPLVVERGAGLYVYDGLGREYLDAVGSWWVSSFGHCHPRIVAAVREQVGRLDHVLMAGFVSAPTLRLTGLLAELLPHELTRIFYSDDGSTSVEVALKIALQYHALRGSGRSEFVGLGGGYHGDTLGAMSVSSIPAFHALFHERFRKHHSVDSPSCYRCPVGKEAATCGAECMDSLEKLFEERGERIAGCIFEPMLQGAAGMRVYPAKVLMRIFALCEKHAVLTIADEVATGFGRTGLLFACEHAGKVPDIMCCAKGLTGGFAPMGITAVNERVFEEFKGEAGSERILYHGHSFTGNPIAAAAACVTMELIAEHRIPASLDKITARFRAGLEQFRDHEVVGDIRSIGLIGAIEFVKNRATREPFPASARFGLALAQAALRNGLLIRPLGDIVYFFPAFIITETQIEEMFAMLHHSLKEVLHAASAH
jgi:adenosylmethionine-8-amino-7-oxononanoate aminotransferase